MGQKRVSKYDGNAPHVSRLHGLVLIASASWLHSGSCQAGWGKSHQSRISSFRRCDTDGLLAYIVLLPINELHLMTPPVESQDFKVISAAFPRIGEKLALYWGEPEFNTLVDELQQNNRGDQRAGFPADVLLALYSLASNHDSAFPQFARKEKDLWNLSKAR